MPDDARWLRVRRDLLLGVLRRAARAHPHARRAAGRVVMNVQRRRLPIADAHVAPPPLDSEVRAVDRVRPTHAVWELTLRCDLSCHHCSSRAGRARDDELTTAEAIDVAAQLADLGVLEVTLIGGEAYLHEGWL